jgi:DNA-binding HxlR family transcriptional regulator
MARTGEIAGTDGGLDLPNGDCTIERVELTLSVIEGKWKLLIIHHLFLPQPMRFSELERAIPRVTQKMLIQQLRALEADGVVERISYPVVPPHVEHRLTSAGVSRERRRRRNSPDSSPPTCTFHDPGRSGIGEATARRLADSGHRVVLGARRTDRIAAIAAAIRTRVLSAPERSPC